MLTGPERFLQRQPAWRGGGESVCVWGRGMGRRPGRFHRTFPVCKTLRTCNQPQLLTGWINSRRRCHLVSGRIKRNASWEGGRGGRWGGSDAPSSPGRRRAGHEARGEMPSHLRQHTKGGVRAGAPGSPRSKLLTRSGSRCLI